MDKLLDAEHHELLKQGISNFPELPKQIQEYLRRQQLKQKQYMKDIQAPYTAGEQAKKKEQEKFESNLSRRKHKKRRYNTSRQ